MTAAILPMKPPAVGKSRLAADLDPSFRRDLALAMFADSLSGAGAATSLEAMIVVTADPDCRRIALASGASVVDEPALEGHSAAAAAGIESAVAAGSRSVLLIPGDCPTIDPFELDRLLSVAGDRSRCVVVPDRHGTGTNALLLTPPDAIAPSFGPGSRDRHLAAAAARGIPAEAIEVPSLGLDVDTPSDLDFLIDRLRSGAPAAPATTKLLSEAGRTPAVA